MVPIKISWKCVQFKSFLTTNPQISIFGYWPILPIHMNLTDREYRFPNAMIQTQIYWYCIALQIIMPDIWLICFRYIYIYIYIWCSGTLLVHILHQCTFPLYLNTIIDTLFLNSKEWTKNNKTVINFSSSDLFL